MSTYLEGLASEGTRNVVLTHVIRDARDRRVNDVGRRTDDDRRRHPVRFLFAPEIDVVTHTDAQRGRKRSDPILGLQHASIVSEVVYAVDGVFGHEMRRRCVGGVVETGGGDWNWQAAKAATSLL